MLDIITYYTGSKGNLYLLHNDNTNILLECGVKAKEIRESLFNGGKLLITDLDGCVITHHHSDHALSVDYISSYIDTYGTNQLQKKCKSINVITPYKLFQIGSIKLFPVVVEHGNAENNAFIIVDKDSCIFFGTDFSLLSNKLNNKFDKVYIECNYEQEKLKVALENNVDEMHDKYLRQLSTHLSLENCIEHLKCFDLSNCKEIILIHNSSNKDLIDTNYAKKLIEKTFKIKTIFGKEKNES